MERYDPNDDATFYFVIFEDDRHTRIQAWTDDKELAKAYMEFHNCNKYHLKVLRKPYLEIVPILNENSNDEIDLHVMTIRNDKDHKKGHETKQIVAPMTDTEATFVREEINTFMASRINYGYMQEAFHYFKPKYQRALRGILFEDVMNKVVAEKRSSKVEELQMDELCVLARSFPEHFN